MLTEEQTALVAIRRLQGSNDEDTLLRVIYDILAHRVGAPKLTDEEGLRPMLTADGQVGILRMPKGRQGAHTQDYERAAGNVRRRRWYQPRITPSYGYFAETSDKKV